MRGRTGHGSVVDCPGYRFIAMRPEGSITHWLWEPKEGDQPAAQQELWNRYFGRLVALARTKLLRGMPRRAEDEEDVALSALDSFFRGARGGRFPDLRDRTQLWPLLVKITVRKALNQLKRQRAQKRGGKVRQASTQDHSGLDDDKEDIEQIVGQEPTPELAAQVAEQCNRLLDTLDNESLRSVACMKLQGYTNSEIAQELDVTARTVGRKLHRIRRQWSEDTQP